MLWTPRLNKESTNEGNVPATNGGTLGGSGLTGPLPHQYQGTTKGRMQNLDELRAFDQGVMSTSRPIGEMPARQPGFPALGRAVPAIHVDWHDAVGSKRY
jgi:hypothetical protein